MSFNNGVNAVKLNVESAGNILQAVSKTFRMQQNADGKYTLVNIAYAQYVKFDVDYTRLFKFDERNSLAFHVGLGVAYPYGNSTICLSKNAISRVVLTRLGVGVYAN